MTKSRKRVRIYGPLEEFEYEALVEVIRGNSRAKRQNEAYNLLENRIKPKIGFIVRQFYIPGFSSDDILQEALFALRFKAIPDYDSSRGRGPDPYPFDKFAMLCIRRHLSTILKGAFQNKKKTLNTSLSLDQDRGNTTTDGLFLSEILPKTEGTVIDDIGDQEFQHELFKKLFRELSSLEQRVFKLYALRYSYEEISAIINKYYRKHKVRKRTNVKSIDNALSRIKQKARLIYQRQEKMDEG